MNLYQREFKYLNTETGKIEKFRGYNFLQHFKHGLVYGNPTRAVKSPFQNIIFKLVNENIIWTYFNWSRDQRYHRTAYEWVNTIIIKDDNASWIRSDSWWVQDYKKCFD